MGSAFGRNEEVWLADRAQPLPAAQRDIRPTLDEEPGLTRSSFLRRVTLGASAGTAATVAVLGLPRLATSTPSAQQDRSILDFLLSLEHTQAAFYAAALEHGSLSGELRQFVEVVGAHERAHVALLRNKLGSSASSPPQMTLAEATADAEHVRATAVALEDIALEAYNGQLPNLTQESLPTVLRIASVEARHAGWVRDLAHLVPAPHAADPLPSEQHARVALQRTGILAEDEP